MVIMTPKCSRGDRPPLKEEGPVVTGPVTGGRRGTRTPDILRVKQVETLRPFRVTVPDSPVITGFVRSSVGAKWSRDEPKDAA